MEQTSIAIDLTYLNSITGGNKAFEQILLTTSIIELNIIITDLDKSWLEKDTTTIRKNAHSLVSLAAIVGMPQVEKWSREIDQIFADGIFHPEVAPLVHSIIWGWPSAYSQLNIIIANN